MCGTNARPDGRTLDGAIAAACQPVPPALAPDWFAGPPGAGHVPLRKTTRPGASGTIWLYLWGGRRRRRRRRRARARARGAARRGSGSHAGFLPGRARPPRADAARGRRGEGEVRTSGRPPRRARRASPRETRGTTSRAAARSSRARAPSAAARGARPRARGGRRRRSRAASRPPRRTRRSTARRRACPPRSP